MADGSRIRATTAVAIVFLMPLCTCTRPNPAYCESDSDCRNPDFPVCDPSIRGCVGAGDAGTVQDADGGSPADPGPADPQDASADRGDPAGPDAGDREPGPAIYVDDDTCPAAGSGTDADPFCRIPDAVEAADGPGVYIVVREGTYRGDLQLNKDLTIQGQAGAVIHTDTCPGGLLVLGGAEVNLRNLVVTGTGGIRVTGNSTLVLLDSRVISTDCVGLECLGSSCRAERNWILRNTGGGALLDACSHQLVNNVIARNGPGVSFGGVWINQPLPGSGFVHNTVVYNTSGTGLQDGVTCFPAASLENSIVWENGDQDLAGNCQLHHVLVDEEPSFVDEDADDFHLETDSAGVDQADPQTSVPEDIDGDARPRGDAPDLGADEVAD